MSDCLNLNGDELQNEWSDYCKSSIDSYFLNINDEKLQKYIDAVNKIRMKHPDIGEIQDSMMEIEKIIDN